MPKFHFVVECTKGEEGTPNVMLFECDIINIIQWMRLKKKSKMKIKTFKRKLNLYRIPSYFDERNISLYRTTTKL